MKKKAISFIMAVIIIITSAETSSFAVFAEAFSSEELSGFEEESETEIPVDSVESENESQSDAEETVIDDTLEDSSESETDTEPVFEDEAGENTDGTGFLSAEESVPDDTEDFSSEFSDTEGFVSEESELALFSEQSDAPDYDVWLGNTIRLGLEMNGTTYGNSMYEIFKDMQEPIYAELGSLILQDVPLMSISSVWNDVIKRDFYNNQKLIYEALLMDYIKYENTANSASFDTSQIDRANSYLIELFNELSQKCLEGYPEGDVQNWKPEQFVNLSVEDAVKSFENLKTMKETVNRVKSVAGNVRELISLAASLSAMEDAKEEKIQLIKKAREAAASFDNPNTDFISACDEIVGQMESTIIDMDYMKTQGIAACMDKLIAKVWGKLCDKNLVLKTIDLGSGAMDVLFNASDAASNNLKLAILYTMDCYFKTALSNASVQYLENKDSAQIFNSCFEGYVEFQMYGNSVAKSWIGSVTDGGALNHAFTYIFYRENLNNASELKNLCDSQNKTRGQILSILEKYQNIYSNLYMKDEYKQAMSVPITPTPVVNPGDYKISEGITSPNPVEESGKCSESVYWKLFEDGTLIVFGNGDCDGVSVLQPKIKKVIITRGIVSIAEDEFWGCENLKTITLPEGLTSVGGRAFAYCSSLESIMLPESLISIGERAFSECSSLESITLPESLISMGWGVFFKCGNLESITLPESLTFIDEYAFYECSSLESITLPESITSIGGRAFAYCSSLTRITLPESITSIGENAFSACSSLTRITLPESITSIDRSAFSECSSLESITLPESLTFIGDYAFSACSSLTSITLPESITSIGWSAFSECSSLESITLPESLTYIGWGAFSECSSLESITLPGSLTYIDWRAFYECSSLESITLPEGLTSIEEATFAGCSNLKSITIPKSVTEIDSYAFKDCDKLSICGYPGSYAETYANEKGIPFMSIIKEGWKKNTKGYWYQNSDGSYPKNQWKKIGKNWYHFDADGYMQTGWLKLGSTWYYLKSTGAMAKDEWVDNGKSYVDANGKYVPGKNKYVEGWKKNPKGYWYQNSDGTYPKNQWKKINGEWYHFDANGYMQTGWLKLGSTWYYLKSTGAMAKNEWVDNGKSYVDANGKYIPGKNKYAEGWKKNPKGYWYQNSDGTYPKSQWRKIKGEWYHFDANGYMQIGWLKLGSTWYYLKSTGAMAKDEWVDNGKSYVDASGKYIPGKKK